MYFVENLEMTHVVRGGGGKGSCCLRHYDALRTKIDMWLTPYDLTFLKLLKKWNLRIKIITIDFSIKFFQKIALDLPVTK